jgi:hypothetical protein
MKYKEILEKQIAILENLQDVNIAANNSSIAKSQAAVNIAEEINRLVASAKEIVEAE